MGNYIKELREDREWSKTELGRRVGCSNQMIGLLESGKRKLTQDWMRRLAAALECYPADLFDGGPERLKPRERDLLKAYRSMSEDTQRTFVKTASALTKPGKSPATTRLTRVNGKQHKIPYDGPERRVNDDPDYDGPNRRNTH